MSWFGGSFLVWRGWPEHDTIQSEKIAHPGGSRVCADHFHPQQKFSVLRTKGSQFDRAARDRFRRVGVVILSRRLAVDGKPQDAVIPAFGPEDGDLDRLIAGGWQSQFHEITHVSRLHKELLPAAPLALSQTRLLRVY